LRGGAVTVLDVLHRLPRLISLFHFEIVVEKEEKKENIKAGPLWIKAGTWYNES
jgi:hypothetical protein